MRPEREKHVLRVNKLYTAAELTDVLMVATDYVDRMANKKAIPFVHLNGTRMYCGWRIREWLDVMATNWDPDFMSAKERERLEARIRMLEETLEERDRQIFYLAGALNQARKMLQKATWKETWKMVQKMVQKMTGSA